MGVRHAAGGVTHAGLSVVDAKLLSGPFYSADRAGSNGMLTRTFRLKYKTPIPMLRPASTNNPINAYPGNNTIVVSVFGQRQPPRRKAHKKSDHLAMTAFLFTAVPRYPITPAVCTQ
ncbi:hypothetical protein [Pseudomonas cyclaminis]|uniref:hypothetical protein n=1 Tax=Pseudomonas cyclaminis TaxID=2781239 RepID=UPI0031345F39